MNWLLGTQGRYSVNVPHWFLSSWGILGTRGGFLMIALHWFLHLSRLLGTGRRFPVIVLHILEKAGRTNMMKGTAVPNYPEYSEKQGEQTWWKGQLCPITRNTAKSRENNIVQHDLSNLESRSIPIRETSTIKLHSHGSLLSPVSAPPLLWPLLPPVFLISSAFIRTYHFPILPILRYTEVRKAI